MKLPKTTTVNPEFVKQKRRETILDAFRCGMGFHVRDAEREEKIEKIIFSEYGETLDDLEKAMNDLDNNVIRFEFASKKPVEQHGVLVVGKKRFEI